MREKRKKEKIEIKNDNIQWMETGFYGFLRKNHGVIN